MVLTRPLPCNPLRLTCIPVELELLEEIVSVEPLKISAGRVGDILLIFKLKDLAYW